MSELKKVIADLTKTFGAGAVSIYSEMKHVEVERVSSGLPSLDYALG
jgi:hypothetical protein